MSLTQYTMHPRDEAAASTSSDAAQSTSSSSHKHAWGYETLALMPWIFILIFLVYLLVAVILRRWSLMLPVPWTKKQTRPSKEDRESMETLLHSGWEKICVPSLAYTADGDNVAPGQEDAVFQTTRNQKRGLFVLYKPLVQEEQAQPVPFRYQS